MHSTPEVPRLEYSRAGRAVPQWSSARVAASARSGAASQGARRTIHPRARFQGGNQRRRNRQAAFHCPRELGVVLAGVELWGICWSCPMEAGEIHPERNCETARHRPHRQEVPEVQVGALSRSSIKPQFQVSSPHRFTRYP